MLPALVWLLTVQALGLAVLPLTVRVFAGLPDRGYALSRVVGIVVVGWLAYLTGMLGFTAYTGATVAVLAGALAAALWLAWGCACLETLRARARLVAFHEVVFLAVFGLAAFVRAYNADIVGQEKFMDYAFMNALLRTTTLPAEDMWLSGFAMPYYYLGYLLVGLPAKLAGTPGPMAYNLAVVLVFAAGFGAAVSIGSAVVSAAQAPCLPGDGPGDGADAAAGGASRAGLAFGLLAGCLTMVVGNLVGPLELIAAQGWGSEAFWRTVGVKGLGPAPSGGLLPADGGWWWRSSRVIPNIQPDGITEFPFFSFLLGDLHPHYVAIPLTLLIAALAASRWLAADSRDDDWPAVALAGVALATLIPASTWDVPAFWGLFALATVGDAWRREPQQEKLLRRLPRLLAPYALAGLLVVPYFVGYQSQPLGLGIVGERTPLVSLLILFGPALLICAAFAGWVARRAAADATLGRLLVLGGLLAVALTALGEPTLALLAALLLVLAGVGLPLVTAVPRAGAVPFGPAALFCWLVLTWAVCILFGVELIFLRDVFGSRMNTVFKFQYQSWLLLGVGTAAALGLIWSGQAARRLFRPLAGLLAAVALLPGLVYPLGATWTKSNGFRGEPTLMGDRFLERSAPGDYRVIEWLRANAQGRPVVVEAVGGDYSEHARVSTFSGLPTLIGWVGHELQWRGDRPELGARQQAVDAVYRATTREELRQLAEKYDIRYVFFGTLERAKYGNEAQQRLDRLLPIAYSRNGTTIYTTAQMDRP